MGQFFKLVENFEKHNENEKIYEAYTEKGQSVYKSYQLYFNLEVYEYECVQNILQKLNKFLDYFGFVDEGKTNEDVK